MLEVAYKSFIASSPLVVAFLQTPAGFESPGWWAQFGVTAVFIWYLIDQIKKMQQKQQEHEAKMAQEMKDHEIERERRVTDMIALDRSDRTLLITALQENAKVVASCHREK